MGRLYSYEELRCVRHAWIWEFANCCKPRAPLACADHINAEIGERPLDGGTGERSGERANQRYGIEPRPLYELHRDAAECSKVGMQRIALIREYHARERTRQNEMTGLERNSMAGELIGKPSHAERGMAEHAGRNPGLLDLGILVHDAADPAQVDVKRLNRPTANDDSGCRAIIGDGIENPARILQARVDYLDRGYDVFGRTQHLG